MLTRLIALLQDAPRGLSLTQISRALDAQPAAVAGMLDWLARAGRLIEVGPDGCFCASCGLEGQCQLLTVHGKRYVVAPRVTGDAPATDGGLRSDCVVQEY